jgi:hypothetical protein
VDPVERDPEKWTPIFRKDHAQKIATKQDGRLIAGRLHEIIA